MTLLPAAPDTGILFRRTDLAGGGAEIAASWRNVVDTRRPKAAPVPGLEDTDVEVEVVDDADEDVLEDTTDLDDGEEGIEVDVNVEPEAGEEER